MSLGFSDEAQLVGRLVLVMPKYQIRYVLCHQPWRGRAEKALGMRVVS